MCCSLMTMVQYHYLMARKILWVLGITLSNADTSWDALGACGVLPYHHWMEKEISFLSILVWR